MPNSIAAATKGIIIKDGKALIIKRSPLIERDVGIWELPGGKLEFGESVTSGLKREIMEETGLATEPERLLYVTDFMTSPDRQVVLIAYLCRYMYGEVRLSDEHCEYCWANHAMMRSLLPEPILENLASVDIESYLV